MANYTGGKIEAVDYDVLALQVNHIYSDTSNGSGGPASLVFSTSDIVLTTTVPNTDAGNVYSLTTAISDENYIVVDVDSVTLKPSEYTVDTDANEITVLISLELGATLRVYNRIRHIYGWGQEPFSVYPHPTFPIDEISVSRILEANINNLIDKVNIMTQRVGANVEITRIAKGNKIYPNFSAAKGDINTISGVIDGHVYANNATWLNDVATVVESIATETRTLDWQNQLQVAFRWNFPSYAEARYFFNSGGECRLSVDMTGDPSDAGYANWVQVVDRMGVVRLNWTTTDQTGTGGVSEGHGFYDLTDTYQPLFTSASPLTPYNTDGDTPGEYGGEYGLYSEYTDLVVLVEGRFVEQENGVHSVDLRVTLDNSSFEQDIAGESIFNAGYKIGDAITDNSATFEPIEIPPIFVIDHSYNEDDN